MAARELITVQCGHFSSFVGTHWWNIQESGFTYDASTSEPREILHDCTFREGLTLTGQLTYTPRLVAIDLSGSLKTLKEEGELYTADPSVGGGGRGKVNSDGGGASHWKGKVERHLTEPAVKNDFLSDLDRMDTGELGEGSVAASSEYDLDSVVDVWSDFLRIPLHPKSLQTIPGHFHNDGSFELHPAGLQVMEKRSLRESLEDKLHFFSEECDHLQGFHLLVDWDGGFGGVASLLAQDIVDEYPGKGIVAFLTSPTVEPFNQTPVFHQTVLNHSLSLGALCSHCSLVCPLSLLSSPWRACQDNVRQFPLVQCKPSLAYHSSAMFAVAMETASLMYRTDQQLASIASLSDGLTALGRKVAALSLSLPVSLSAQSSLVEELDHTPLAQRLRPLTPFCTPDDEDRSLWSQAVTLRGLPPDYPLRQRQGGVGGHPTHVMAEHLSQHSPSASSRFCTVHKPLPLYTPFPEILPTRYHKAHSAPVCASMSSESGLHQLVGGLLREVGATNVRALPSFRDTCLDADSYSDLVHTLESLSENYQAGFSPDDSTDSD